MTVSIDHSAVPEIDGEREQQASITSTVDGTSRPRLPSSPGAANCLYCDPIIQSLEFKIVKKLH